MHVSLGMLGFRADPNNRYHDKNSQKDKVVMPYCASGRSAAVSGKLRKDIGYREVYNLGSFKNWVQSSGSVDQLIE